MPYKDLEKRRESTRIRMVLYRERKKNDSEYWKRKREVNRKSWEKNKDNYSIKSREWYEQNRNSQLKKMKLYREKNKEKLNQQKKESNKIRRKTDSNFLIKSRLRCLLYNSIKLYGNGNPQRSSKYGINWNECAEKLGPCPSKNRREFHIDHIIPISNFDLNKPDQVKKAFSPDNLQWLSAINNIKKSNKLLTN